MDSDGSDFYAAGASVFRTRDGGRTWADPGNAGLASSLGALVVDPRDPETLFGSGVGVFRTTNGGASWSRRGLDDLNVWSLALDPHRPDTLYAGILTNGPTAPSGIRRSFDGGRTWVDGSVGCRRSVRAGFHFRPLLLRGSSSPRVVSAAARTGVFRSTNGGGSWSQVLEGSVDALASAAGDPDTLYAGGLGVWRSRDGGDTWQHFDIGPFGFVTALAVDPAEPAVLMAAANNNDRPKPRLGRIVEAFQRRLRFHLSFRLAGRLLPGKRCTPRARVSSIARLPVRPSRSPPPHPCTAFLRPYFHSDVSVFNASTSQATVVATYRCLGGLCPPVRKEFTIPARQVRLFEDMVATFFLQPDSGGAVEFESAAPLSSRAVSIRRPTPRRRSACSCPGFRSTKLSHRRS